MERTQRTNRPTNGNRNREMNTQTEQKKHEISTGCCGNRIDITGAADCRRNEKLFRNIFRVKSIKI